MKHPGAEANDDASGLPEVDEDHKPEVKTTDLDSNDRYSINTKAR